MAEGSPRDPSSKLQADRKNNDALRAQLADALIELRTVSEARSGSVRSELSMPEQARLLQEAQHVVIELKDDLMALQQENSELRRQLESDESKQPLESLRASYDESLDKLKKELKEARFKNLRLQQEKQKLKSNVSELELELSGRPSTLVMEEEAAEKIRLLEAANDELRRDNASLREQKLAFMTSELNRLHPAEGVPEDETERLNNALRMTVHELTVAKQKIAELEQISESQEDLLQRRSAEYEGLLVSRKAELETMSILTQSLDETKELYDEAQQELSQLREDNRELASKVMIAEATRGDPNDKSVDELKDELAVVRKTAGDAISTLSNSLKKALLQSQELCQNFERDRLEMKEVNEAANRRIVELEDELEQLHQSTSEIVSQLQKKDEELNTFKLQIEEQRERTKEAKQKLKAEILDTKQLLKAQHEEVGLTGDPDDDDEYLALLDTPNRALYTSPLRDDS
eukprot:TRINITY_DN6958_c0_g1_i2.p1 TRINITY_DN6958_c0_g1~~TRINITY_DN6958_c0_g1_i2.p1  ORF type:complete len:473 (+),score=212.65 TRINITY_DN6958_c0_g1_i2:30-1421(+)